MLYLPRCGAEPLSTSNVEVLVAVIRVYERDGRATVRSVSDACWRNLSTTHAHLRTLRDAGFVAWEENREATLRPLVRRVPFGVARAA